MKTMILLLQLMFAAPNDSELMQIKIDVQEPVRTCSMYLLVGDEKYPIHSPEIEGSIATLYLKEYYDYHLVINGHNITITPMAYEVVDERDLSISVDGTYEFKKDVLVFTFNTYAKKQ